MEELFRPQYSRLGKVNLKMSKQLKLPSSKEPQPMVTPPMVPTPAELVTPDPSSLPTTSIDLSSFVVFTNLFHSPSLG